MSNWMNESVIRQEVGSVAGAVDGGGGVSEETCSCLRPGRTLTGWKICRAEGPGPDPDPSEHCPLAWNEKNGSWN